MNRNNRISPDINNIHEGNFQSSNPQHTIVNNNNIIEHHQQSSQAIIKKVQLHDPTCVQRSLQQISINPRQQQQPQQQPIIDIDNTTLYTCRICLQQSPSLHANNQHQLQNLLQKLNQQSLLPEPKFVITTCKCQGTSGYVHQRCIIKWIDAQYKRTKQKQMKCQICLQQILYQKRTIPYFQFTIKNCQNLSPCNIVCFTTILVVLAAFIILQTQSQMLGLTDLVQLTIFILIAIFIVALIFSIVLIVKETFYKKRKQTTKVFTNDQIEIKGIMKEKLTHYQRRSSTHRTQVSGMRSARTIRSARNIQARNGQRVPTGNMSARSQHQNVRQQQRSQRIINFDVEQQSHQRQEQQRQNQGEVLVRSLRVIRNSPARARSVHIRSRQQLQ